MWMPLCAAIIFGLLASTLICLFVIPCLYLLLTPKQPAENAAADGENVVAEAV